MKFILLLLLVAVPTYTQHFIEPVNNTVGIFYHEEANLKISNDKWTLLVYKDLSLVKNSLKHNDRLLERMSDLIYQPTNRMSAFRAQVKTHISLLSQISNSLNTKFQSIFSDAQSASRMRRGLINGIGTFWKAITGNLDSDDGEYYNSCINKLSQDEHQIENLMKNQISVTTSVIRSFNNTIRKLQLDEETFNSDLVAIELSIYNISDTLAFYEAHLEMLEMCEALMESYIFLEENINDILNSITFSRLRIIHTSIINSKDLLYFLQQISHNLVRNNLPLPAYDSQVATYLDIIELEAFQTESKVIFALKIPLVEPETYTLYKIIPLPIPDNRTGLFHVILTSRRYIARSDDSLLYLSLRDPEKCKNLPPSTKLCSDIMPYPVDENALCEAQLLRYAVMMPKTCQTTIVAAEGYTILALSTNHWLVTVTNPVPVTMKCPNKGVVTKTIGQNSILKLQPDCNAFIGSTRVHSKPRVETYKNMTYKSHPVEIPFHCCKNIPKKEDLPELKPLKLNRLYLEDLEIAHHKLTKNAEELDKIINEPFISKHRSWFTYTVVAIIFILLVLYIICKCRKRKPFRLSISGPVHPDDDSNPGGSFMKRYPRIFPRRRPSFQREDIQEEIQLT